MNKRDVYVLAREMSELIRMFACTEPCEAVRDKLETQIENVRIELKKALDGDNP